MEKKLEKRLEVWIKIILTLVMLALCLVGLWRFWLAWESYWSPADHPGLSMKYAFEGIMAFLGVKAMEVSFGPMIHENTPNGPQEDRQKGSDKPTPD